MPVGHGLLPMLLAVVGESHADPFIGAYVLDQQSRAPVAFSHHANIPSLRADFYLDEQQRISAKIIATLCMLRFLFPCQVDHPEVISPALLEPNIMNFSGNDGWRINRALRDAPILFVSGDVDARHVIRAIPPYADVPVPFDATETALIPTFPASAVITESSINTAVTSVLAPMFRGLSLLREIGFSTIALHSISPPTPDDAQYLREINYDTRALTRYKVIMLFNQAVRTYCMQHDFLYIDRWLDFTDGGLIRDGYGVDAVHIEATYMRQSLEILYNMIVTRRPQLLVEHLSNVVVG